MLRSKTGIGHKPFSAALPGFGVRRLEASLDSLAFGQRTRVRQNEKESGVRGPHSNFASCTRCGR